MLQSTIARDGGGGRLSQTGLKHSSEIVWAKLGWIGLSTQWYKRARTGCGFNPTGLGCNNCQQELRLWVDQARLSQGIHQHVQDVGLRTGLVRGTVGNPLIGCSSYWQVQKLELGAEGAGQSCSTTQQVSGRGKSD